ncbi:MAG: DNA helicase [Acidimicrobiales bacterium]|nr:MAG: DNA helicase [Acidimicrobiales bacterium]
MAFLLPENLPTRSDVAAPLQSIARLLRDALDDRATVWCRGLPPEDAEDTEPHLVILIPNAGIVVLGVAGRRRRRAPSEPPEDKEWAKVGALDSRSFVELIENAAAEIASRLEEAGLTSDRCPVVSTLALPTTTRAQLESSGNIPEGASRQVLTADDLHPERIAEALIRVLGGEKPPLEENFETRARAAVNPQIVIHDPRREHFEQGKLIFRPPENGEDPLVALDREQEKVARYLGSGYRVLKGVAGSGKTIVLTKRVRFLAELFPHKKYLLTCYNRVLATALQNEVKDLQNVTVSTIDGLAAKITRIRAGLDFDERCRRAIKMLEWDDVGVFRHYDGVFVDEAQDLDDTRMTLAWMFLKLPSCDFVVTKDVAQNIYRRSTVWNPPGQSARGRTIILRSNYRNTMEILQFAHGFLSRGVAIDAQADHETEDVIIPPEACAQKGPEPEVVQVPNQWSEVDFIVEQAIAAHKEGIEWGDMAVLCHQKKWQGMLYAACRRRNIPYFFAAWNDNAKREVVQHTDKLRCFTYHSAKGLEFPLVFVADVNSVRATDPDELEAARSLVYSALTRATHRLVVTVRGEGPIGAELLAAATTL